MSLQDQMRKGSTELLLLRLLTREPMYGYQISQELHRQSNGYFEMKEGLLYPTLHRMQKGGLVTAEWQQATGQRRRKYYSITATGEKALTEQSAEWQRFMAQMQLLLGGDAA